MCYNYVSGADVIISYYTPRVLEWLKQDHSWFQHHHSWLNSCDRVNITCDSLIRNLLIKYIYSGIDCLLMNYFTYSDRFSSWWIPKYWEFKNIRCQWWPPVISFVSKSGHLLHHNYVVFKISEIELQKMLLLIC